MNENEIVLFTNICQTQAQNILKDPTYRSNECEFISRKSVKTELKISEYSDKMIEGMIPDEYKLRNENRRILELDRENRDDSNFVNMFCPTDTLKISYYAKRLKFLGTMTVIEFLPETVEHLKQLMNIFKYPNRSIQIGLNESYVTRIQNIKNSESFNIIGQLYTTYIEQVVIANNPKESCKRNTARDNEQDMKIACYWIYKCLWVAMEYIFHFPDVGVCIELYTLLETIDRNSRSNVNLDDVLNRIKRMETSKMSIIAIQTFVHFNSLFDISQNVRSKQYKMKNLIIFKFPKWEMYDMIFRSYLTDFQENSDKTYSDAIWEKEQIPNEIKTFGFLPNLLIVENLTKIMSELSLEKKQEYLNLCEFTNDFFQSNDPRHKLCYKFGLYIQNKFKSDFVSDILNTFTENLDPVYQEFELLTDDQLLNISSPYNIDVSNLEMSEGRTQYVVEEEEDVLNVNYTHQGGTQTSYTSEQLFGDDRSFNDILEDVDLQF